MVGSQARKPAVLVGIGWMVLSGVCFVGVAALVKLLGNDLPVMQSVFLRYVLGLVFLAPMMRPMLQSGMSGRTLFSFTARGVIHSAGVFCWFYAMTQITIAEVTALNYLAPVLVTIGAAVFLGEHLAIRRLLAVCAGLIGAIIILRPGVRELSLGHFAMFGTAATFAVSFLLAKRLSDTMNAATIVGMLSITVTIVVAPFAAVVWVTPTAWQLFVLFLVATFATAGHYSMTLAFRSAPVSATQPATFLQLIWSAALGLLFFGEALDPMVIFGGAIIISSASFIAWRETVVAAESRQSR